MPVIREMKPDRKRSGDLPERNFSAVNTEVKSSSDAFFQHSTFVVAVAVVVAVDVAFAVAVRVY